MVKQELIAIGHIGRAVGLKGFCSVYPTGLTFQTLQTPIAVYVGRSEQQVDQIEIEQIKEQPKGFIVKFAGISDRSAAEELNGKDLYITEDLLPELQDGEFYHFQLQGLKVVADTDSRYFGEVIEIISLPTTDALEVKLKNGNTVLIPYNDQAVISVDREAGLITVKGSFIEEML